MILVFAGITWFLFQEKSQILDNVSVQQTSPSALPSNAGKSLNPTALLDTGSAASTNILMTLSPSVIFVTNSN